MINIQENYLWFGYNPINLNDDSWLYDFHNEDYIYDLNESKKILDLCFDNILDNLQIKGVQCVPLSGGLDSRYILGALRERLNSNEIIAYSFGKPGQLDYEIAKKICKNFNIKHYLINLNEVDFSYNSLLESVGYAKWTYMPDAYIQTLGYKLATDLNCENIWSGFMGDFLTGGHYSGNEKYRIEDFIKSQKRSLKIKNDKDFIFNQFNGFYDFEVNSVIRFNEFLDFKIRQTNCISKIILGETKLNTWSARQNTFYQNVEIITPFLDKVWAGYWLNMPRELHKNQKRYKELGLSKYTKLFDIPFKYQYGTNSSILRFFRRFSNSLSTIMHNKYPKLNCRLGIMDNYLNYPIDLKKSKDWLRSLEYLIYFMKENDLEYEDIVLNHLNGKENNAEDIILLLGLVLNLDYISGKGNSIGN
jgi:hypothetical protein